MGTTDKGRPHPFRLSAELARQLRETSARMELSVSDLMRAAIDCIDATGDPVERTAPRVLQGYSDQHLGLIAAQCKRLTVSAHQSLFQCDQVGPVAVVDPDLSKRARGSVLQLVEQVRTDAASVESDAEHMRELVAGLIGAPFCALVPVTSAPTDGANEAQISVRLDPEHEMRMCAIQAKAGLASKAEAYRLVASAAVSLFDATGQTEGVSVSLTEFSRVQSGLAVAAHDYAEAVVSLEKVAAWLGLPSAPERSKGVVTECVICANASRTSADRVNDICAHMDGLTEDPDGLAHVRLARLNRAKGGE